jgi:tellurite resistance protein TehA-like permease
MNEVHQALKGYSAAKKAAHVLGAAQTAALCCATASLVLGTVRTVKKLRERNRVS